MPVAYALIHEENDVFGISFPDFPGCISVGDTAETAIVKGTEVLTFHVSGMADDGEKLPMLRTLAELQADPDFKEDCEGGVLALVPFELPGKSVRINISIDENLLSLIDHATAKTGESRSGWLANAARNKLAKVS